MRSAGWPIAAVAPPARVLLLVLTAHLSCMTLPFHIPMFEGAGDHQTSSAPAAIGSDHGLVSAEQPHLDCTIRWAPSPQAAPLSLLGTVTVPGWASECTLAVRAMRPLPRANGPPSGDRQALLQVFRL